MRCFQMPGLEIYELWLRTGWADPADWVEFLCEGEGVFGDCETPNTGSLSGHWPGEIEGDKQCSQDNCHHSLNLNNQ